MRKAVKDADAHERGVVSLNAEVMGHQEKLAQAGQSGHIKAAGIALTALRDLLTVPPYGRTHSAILRDNGVLGRQEAPTWDHLLSRVLWYLSVSSKLQKAEVEKVRLLLDAALSAGAGALSPKTEVKIFCYICLELGDHARVPPKADKSSAHPECVSVLLRLTSSCPRLLARITPDRRRWLLDKCIVWIAGEPPASTDGADGARVDVSSTGPDRTIADMPQLMVFYAQLLNQLVAAWVGVRRRARSRAHRAPPRAGSRSTAPPLRELLRALASVSRTCPSSRRIRPTRTAPLRCSPPS